MPTPLTIFAYEYLTSGACLDVPTDSSLMTEGRAMAEAVIADMASLEETQVVTLRDHRLPAWEISDVTVHCISSQSEEENRFHELSASADRILIVAPESQGVLQERLETARKINSFAVKNVFGPALEIGCDKWKLAECCRKWDIPHSPTELWNGQNLGGQLPAVIKPRDGAGCEGIHIVCEEPGITFQTAAIHSQAESQFVVQPLMEGISLSSAACFSSVGECLMRLPLGLQRLGFDETIQYRGGEIPWHSQLANEATRQADAIWQVLEEQLEGLWGYVGIDWLWDEERDLLRLLEINPRLTSSYVGYRRLVGNQIANALLNERGTVAEHSVGSVRFSADGQLEYQEFEEHPS